MISLIYLVLFMTLVLCSIANNHEICEGVEIRMRYTCVRVSNKADRDLLAI